MQRRDTLAGASGAAAEALAAEFLTQRGLTIVARNFRTRFGEIDLVARDHGTLVFVEVRLRGYRVARRTFALGGKRRLEVSIPLEKAR